MNHRAGKTCAKMKTSEIRREETRRMDSFYDFIVKLNDPYNIRTKRIDFCMDLNRNIFERYMMRIKQNKHLVSHLSFISFN